MIPKCEVPLQPYADEESLPSDVEVCRDDVTETAVATEQDCHSAAKTEEKTGKRSNFFGSEVQDGAEGGAEGGKASHLAKWFKKSKPSKLGPRGGPSTDLVSLQDLVITVVSFNLAIIYFYLGSHHLSTLFRSDLSSLLKVQ